MRAAMNQASIGVVVIGRNEGERLRACLTSIRDVAARVYVDSGSTDGSCALARTIGHDVVELDLSQGFTAARARNAGIEHLLRRHPGLEFIQTVDGDCEVRADWLSAALADLIADDRRAVAFGRRRERHPERNAYHLACDDEWNVATGAVNSCGGDALFRTEALREVNGYNGALIAGEEPDLCLRLRQKGWRIWSNGQEMTWHDVAIDRFQQWWHRSRRTGFAIAELVDMHGTAADPGWRRLLNSAVGWTLVSVAAVPALLALAIWGITPLTVAALLFPALTAVQLVRLAYSRRRRYGVVRALRWGMLMMAAKAAQTYGWAQFKLQRVTRRRATLIEYKL